ncbi:hypothetical protein ZWY2020_052725 [Hordeum vulgare]|nr:hypothetical protein ZWY2020_052725 [Hordeum vulgare]
MTMRRTAAGVVLLVAALLLLSTRVARAEDPYVFFEWHVTYGTKNIVGTPQKVILINGEFPGPRINCSSNNNIMVNVFNQLTSCCSSPERHPAPQELVAGRRPGTNCPAAPAPTTPTIGSPRTRSAPSSTSSIGMQRAVGASASSASSAASSSRSPLTPPPTTCRSSSATGSPRTTPSWPASLTPGAASAAPRACSSMQGRQGGHTHVHLGGCQDVPPPHLQRRHQVVAQLPHPCHDMKLVEIDSSHTLQDSYDALDVHVGQCLSVLVDADQKPADYLMVASTRFMADASSVSAVVRYAGSNTPPAPNVPEPPAGWAWSLNQWRSFRWNLTASAARPNPQGSYHYGQINITRTIKLLVTRGHIDGKLKYGFNGVSHVDADTPLKLAEYFNISDQVFKYNQMADTPPAVNGPMHVAPNVITAEFRTFIEVVFENPEKSMDSVHIDGYAFFAVGMGPGKWTPDQRMTYNLLDAVSRHTIQVYPRSWSAVMLTFDNAGMWNVRSNLWERHYLGEQLYMSVVSPARSLRDEYNMPENALRCGKVVGLPLPPSYLPA